MLLIQYLAAGPLDPSGSSRDRSQASRNIWEPTKEAKKRWRPDEIGRLSSLVCSLLHSPRFLKTSPNDTLDTAWAKKTAWWIKHGSWLMSPLNITQPLGIWSIMATIRWCPIFPKWDSYQPLSEVYQFVRLWDVQHIVLSDFDCFMFIPFFPEKKSCAHIHIYIYTYRFMYIYIYRVYTYTLQ